MDVEDVIPPEVPALADARIVEHPASGRECLLARDEEGRRLAFAFETEGDAPGISLVDPDLWWEAADDEEPPERSARRFDVFEEPWADEWLPAITAHPVGSEWLGRIKEHDPDAFHTWFAQAQYEEGGEEGSG